MLLNIEDIMRELKLTQGIDLKAFAGDFLLQKIGKRMDLLQVENGQKYLDHIRKQPSEGICILQEIGINVSGFFRNPLVFEMLGQKILPAIIQAKRNKGCKEIRAWSSGCATGEEPYSIAIQLKRILKDELADWQIFVFATDINRDTLNKASQGVYPRDRLLDTRLGIVDDYFTPRGEAFVLDPAIRELVNFSFDDLAAEGRNAPMESLFGGFDLVLCRNVLIYFNMQAKSLAIQKLSDSLNRGGYLVLGEAEWIPDSEMTQFAETDHKNRIYRKR